jgi:hypothetical protein
MLESKRSVETTWYRLMYYVGNIVDVGCDMRYGSCNHDASCTVHTGTSTRTLPATVPAVCVSGFSVFIVLYTVIILTSSKPF